MCDFDREAASPECSCIRTQFEYFRIHGGCRCDAVHGLDMAPVAHVVCRFEHDSCSLPLSIIRPDFSLSTMFFILLSFMLFSLFLSFLHTLQFPLCSSYPLVCWLRLLAEWPLHFVRIRAACTASQLEVRLLGSVDWWPVTSTFYCRFPTADVLLLQLEGLEQLTTTD